MSYQKHNFTPGAVLLASQLNDMDNEIEALSQGGSGGTVLSDDFKEALLNCFENVAWINENGQTYYDALYNSLYPDNMWFITNILTGCITSNNETNILKNNSYVATITANEGYTLDGATVSITMGGNDVTNLYYSSGSINIPNVTGDLVITVSAVSAVSSISAVFAQGSATIYENANLNILKQYLTVTATFSDSTTATVTDYTLSGTLTVGTSTITVSYGGKTDTFNVTVTERAGILGYVPDGLLMLLDGIANGENGTHNTNISTLYDQSGNGYNWVSGVGSVTATDKALVFNGSSNLAGASSWKQNALTEPKTVEVVVNVTSPATTACAISGLSVAQGVRNTTSYGVISAKSSNLLHYTGSSYGCIPITSGVHTYTFVNDNGTWIGYKDGVRISFGSTTISWKSGYKRLGSFEGQDGGNMSYYFTGSLYSYRYYTEALSAEEVSENYSNDVARFELGG